MERLTERDEFGNADIIGVDSEDLQLNLDFEQMNKVTDALNKLSEYEDLEELIGIPLKELAEIFRQYIPEDCKHPQKAVVLTDDDVDRWDGYKNADEQGLLLRLPCKVGDTVYSVTRNFISEYTICSIIKYNEGFFFNWRCEKGIYVNARGFTNYQIGKDVFLTQAEAEQKLKEMENK